MGFLQDSFKDLSFKGQAKNPLQLIFNPMAVGTVGIATAKDLSDKNKGWFSNAFKKKESGTSGVAKNGIIDDTLTPKDNTTYYLIGGAVLLVIIVMALTIKKATK